MHRSGFIFIIIVSLLNVNFCKSVNEHAPHRVVKKILKNGGCINLNQRIGTTTPLVSAAAAGDVSTIELFLEHGADINYLDEVGNSALSTALFNKNADAALYLLRHGANPYLPDIYGNTSFSSLDSEYFQPNFVWPQELLDELQEYPFSFESFKQWSQSLMIHNLND